MAMARQQAEFMSMTIMSIYFFFAFFTTVGEALPQDSEIQGLLAFKSGIAVDRNGLMTNWTSSNINNVCRDWLGIRCGRNNSHIIGLSFSEDPIRFQGEISGSITEDISKLEFLQVLSLNMRLFKKIPDAFSQLTQLKSLELSVEPVGFEQDFSSVLQLLERMSHLEHLVLYRCRLRGKIPFSIGNLSNLRDLDLSINDLVGEVPFSIGNLSNLRELDLSSNDLVGEVPHSIAQLSKLQTLDLSGNSLSGAFPVWKNNSLREMSVGNNERLQVNLPLVLTEFDKLTLLYASYTMLMIHATDMPALPTIEHLSLENTGIHSFPTALANCSNLTFLDLSDNHLSGQIPSSVFNLPQLQELHLSDNELSLIPSSIGNNSKLGSLTLDGNKFHDIGVLVNLFRLPALRELDLSHNQLHGTIPSYLGTNHSAIGVLTLRNNTLRGSLPDNLVQLLSDGELDISDNYFIALPRCLGGINVLKAANNHLAGEIPQEPCFYVNLSTLDLSENNFTGTIPFSLGAAADMGLLYLQGNHLTGGLPAFMANLTGLVDFQAHDNMLSGDINMVDFSRLNLLESLSIHDNSFAGVFPQTLNSSSLYYVNIAKNQISGSLPSHLMLSDAYNGVVLQWSDNELSGTLPENIWNISHLQVLDVSNNHLCGDFSAKDFSQLGAFKGAIEFIQTYPYEPYLTTLLKGNDRSYDLLYFDGAILNLAGNRFRGSLPPTIGSLFSLQFLNISHNNFSGTIPETLGNLTKLVQLDISGNQFTGSIPSSFASSLIHLEAFNSSFNRLSGAIPTGNQFNTFDESSYRGNPGLCGWPILNRCIIAVSNDPAVSATSPDVSELRLWGVEMSMAALFTGGVVGFVSLCLFTMLYKLK